MKLTQTTKNAQYAARNDHDLNTSNTQATTQSKWGVYRRGRGKSYLMSTYTITVGNNHRLLPHSTFSIISINKKENRIRNKARTGVEKSEVRI